MQHHHLHDRLDVYCSFTLSLRHWCLMQHHPLYDRLMFTAASPFIWQTRVYCSITLSPDRLVAGGQVVQHQTVQTWNCITSSSSSRITSPGTLTTKKSERENFTSLSWKQVLEGFKFWSDLLLLAKLIKTQAAEEHFFSVAKGRQKSVLCCPVAQTVCLHRGTERIGLLGLGNEIIVLNQKKFFFILEPTFVQDRCFFGFYHVFHISYCIEAAWSPHRFPPDTGG